MQPGEENVEGGIFGQSAEYAAFFEEIPSYIFGNI